MLEGPFGHLSALLSCFCVRGPEVDTLIDADVFNILGRIGKAGVRARLLNGLGMLLVSEKVFSSVPKKSSSIPVIEPVRLLAPEV